MDPMTQVLMGLQLANGLFDLYIRAAAALNEGDEDKAREYLGEARSRFDAAVAEWNAAANPLAEAKGALE